MPSHFTIAVSLLLFISSVKSATYTDEALQDQILNLPGSEKLTTNFNQFSGYLSLNNDVNHTKHMHYWMVESMSDPLNDPLAFWTNGGPGCSGLLGFMTEQGPFRVNKDMTLSLNEYAWNQKTNMVFIESPCGVGFSYSDNSDVDYQTDDAQTAADNYALIQSFLTRFPSLAKNDLYITSESYGGHYMPTLAKEIVTQNRAGANPSLNFKGFAVGNPATTVHSTIPASMEAYWGHQLVSKPTWDSYTSLCKENLLKNAEECEKVFMKMYLQVDKDLNPYALDYPTCVDSSSSSSVQRFGRAQRTWLMRNAINNVFTTSEDRRKAAYQAVGLEPDGSYEPCADDYMTTYLNTLAVKQAIHVKEDLAWADCSRTLRYKQSDGLHTMVPIYKELISGKHGLNILVYSGDDDGVCATVGTQGWIWGMGYEVSGAGWQAYTVAGQTAGYLTKWTGTNFAFMTVHGAGHEVPSYKPEVALYLWNSYLSGDLTNA